LFITVSTALSSHGYLSGLSRLEQLVYFFRQVVGVPQITKEVLSRRTQDYQRWVGAFAANHDIPITWAEKGVRQQEEIRPYLRQREKSKRYAVYSILKSLEQGTTFPTPPKYPTAEPHYRLLVKPRSRFTHYYVYLRDVTLGPLVMRVASFFPFQTTYYLNGHSFVEQECTPPWRRSSTGITSSGPTGRTPAVRKVLHLSARSAPTTCATLASRKGWSTWPKSAVPA
jgi:hypothetical protein